MGTAAPGCPAEQRSAFSGGDQYRSSLARRPKGTVSTRFPVLHERDARAHME